jgi:hypothetical protein
LFALGYDIQRNAIRAEQAEGFDPTTSYVTRESNTVKRWIRGFFSGGILQVAINIWHVLYFLASLSCVAWACMPLVKVSVLVLPTWQQSC